jgi:hypothetical protein
MGRTAQGRAATGRCAPAPWATRGRPSGPRGTDRTTTVAGSTRPVAPPARPAPRRRAAPRGSAAGCATRCAARPARRGPPCAPPPRPCGGCSSPPRARTPGEPRLRARAPARTPCAARRCDHGRRPPRAGSAQPRTHRRARPTAPRRFRGAATWRHSSAPVPRLRARRTQAPDRAASRGPRGRCAAARWTDRRSAWRPRYLPAIRPAVPRWPARRPPASDRVTLL